MVESDQDQKTEEASDKRIREARDEGQLAVSREMSTWFMFVAIMALVVWLGPALGSKSVLGLRIFLDRPEQLSLMDGGLQDVLIGVAAQVALAATLVFGSLFIMSIIGTMIQTGFYMNPARIKVDADKVFGLQGMKRVFSTEALVELLKSFIKMVVMGYLAYRVLRPIYEDVPLSINHELPDMLHYLHDKAIRLIATLMVLITLIAVVDWVYVRYKYFKNLRMTKQEVKEEYKQMEGDPFVKGRLRRIRMERARRRMMAAVPESSVVITNPTHYAVALKYEPSEMMAPVVVAKGPDLIALRIRNVAEAHDVPVVSNPPLARALFDTAEIDQPINPEHYRAVAEVISYVYKLKGKKK
ncbi:MAG: flagellar biosynthesis protein FlhB [Bdellovibrionales bacterium]